MDAVRGILGEVSYGDILSTLRAYTSHFPLLITQPSIPLTHSPLSYPLLPFVSLLLPTTHFQMLTKVLHGDFSQLTRLISEPSLRHFFFIYATAIITCVGAYLVLTGSTSANGIIKWSFKPLGVSSTLSDQEDSDGNFSFYFLQ